MSKPSCDKMDVVWWLLVGMHLLALWLVPHFITQDGSAHLYTASVFIQLLEGTSPFIAETYQLNEWYVPAWGGGLYLVLLVKLFGVFAAEKILISTIIVLLACGFRRILQVMEIRDKLAPFLILPFLFNHILMMGLYYYLLALALSLILFAYCYTRLEKVGPKDAVVWGGCFLFIFYIHPVPPALAGIGLMLFSFVCCLKMKSSVFQWFNFKALFWLGLSALPSGLVGVLYMSGSSYEGAIAKGIGVMATLQDIVSVTVLVSFQRSPHWWSLICASLLLVMTLRLIIVFVRRRNFEARDLWLVFSCGVILLIAFVPEGVTGGTLMAIRLQLVFWLCWTIWVAFRMNTAEVRWLRKGICAVFILAAVMQITNTVTNMKRIGPFISDVQRLVKQIPDHSRVWPIVLNTQGIRMGGAMWAPRNPWLTHSGLRFLASRKDIAAQIAYQGEVGHFITKFRQPQPSQYFKDGFDDKPEEYVYFKDKVGWVLFIGSMSERENGKLNPSQSVENEFGIHKLLPIKW